MTSVLTPSPVMATRFVRHLISTVLLRPRLISRMLIAKQLTAVPRAPHSCRVTTHMRSVCWATRTLGRRLATARPGHSISRTTATMPPALARFFIWVSPAASRSVPTSANTTTTTGPMMKRLGPNDSTVQVPNGKRQVCRSNTTEKAHKGLRPNEPVRKVGA